MSIRNQILPDEIMPDENSPDVIKELIQKLQENFQKTFDDINAAVGDSSHPIGSSYTQYPDADSNVAAAAFPTSKAPAALFGGTWTKQWNTEATYFRTQGDPDASETENDNRTNGLQPDQFQDWQAGVDADSTGAKEYWGLSSTRDYVSTNDSNVTGYTKLNAGTSGQGDSKGIIPKNDGTHGDPRTGYTTQVKNRIIIVWKRTA